MYFKGDFKTTLQLLPVVAVSWFCFRPESTASTEVFLRPRPPVSLTGWTDADRLDLEDARLGGAVRGLDGLPSEADLEGEMRCSPPLEDAPRCDLAEDSGL